MINWYKLLIQLSKMFKAIILNISKRNFLFFSHKFGRKPKINQTVIRVL